MAAAEPGDFFESPGGESDASPLATATLPPAPPASACVDDDGRSQEKEGGLQGLERARRLFRQQAPVAVVLSELRKSSSSCSWTDWEAQEALCRLLLLHDPLLDDTFPMAADYRARFLRRLSEALEEEGAEEIAEPILRELNAFLLRGGYSGSGDAPGLDSYVVFECPVMVGSDARTKWVPLACRVAPRENQVGLKLWEACFVLADYLLACTPECVQGKRVVELGAGVGLLGLIARFCLGARRVTLTDVDPEVLRFLRHNVQANEGLVGNMGGGVNEAEDEASSIEVAALDWADTADYQGLLLGREGEEDGPSVILAADCIYDREAIPSFVSVLGWALRQDASTVALVASTLRNPATYALFEEEVRAQGLMMEELATPGVDDGRKNGDALASWWVVQREQEEGAADWRYESPFYCPNRKAVRLCRIRLSEAGLGEQ